MHTYRFFVPPDLIQGDQVKLIGDEYHHCCHTLRFRPGDEFEVCDGCGNLYRVTLTQATKKDALGTVVAQLSTPPEDLRPITLGLGITRGQAFETIVAQATALGVTRLVPLRTRQSVAGRFNGERYRKVAIAAMKQAGRTRLPAILPASELTDFLQTVKDHDLKLVGEQQARQNWWSLMNKNQSYSSAAAVVGPEAGLTTDELKLLEANGFYIVSLAKFRLRSELAAAVLLSFINLLFDKEVENGL